MALAFQGLFTRRKQKTPHTDAAINKWSAFTVRGSDYIAIWLHKQPMLSIHMCTHSSPGRLGVRSANERNSRAKPWQATRLLRGESIDGCRDKEASFNLLYNVRAASDFLLEQVKPC